MIAALVTYPEWNRLAAEAPGQFPLPPTASEEACASALARLPEHPVKVHLFEKPATLPINTRLSPAQFLVAILGVMAVRFRGDPGFRLGRGRYLVHGGEKTAPADCFLLELTTGDGNRATCVLAAARRGGTLNVTLGSAAREPYSLTRWLMQWGGMVFMGLIMGFPAAIVAGMLTGTLVVAGLPPVVYLFAPLIALAIMCYFGSTLWYQGVVRTRDNKTMPADGESFVKLLDSAVYQIVRSGPAAALAEAGWQPEGPLSLDDEDERHDRQVRARPVTPPADPKPEPPVGDDDRD